MVATLEQKLDIVDVEELIGSEEEADKICQWGRDLFDYIGRRNRIQAQ